MRMRIVLGARGGGGGGGARAPWALSWIRPCMLSYKVDNEMGREVVCIYLGVLSLTVGMGVQMVIGGYINCRHSEAYKSFRHSLA